MHIGNITECISIYYTVNYKSNTKKRTGGVFNYHALHQFTFNKEIRKVPLNNVVYFESRNRVVYIVLSSGHSEYFYGKLNGVEKELADSRCYFLRIHQSFLVNYDYIKKMNYLNVTVYIGDRELELKISEDRQKEVRRQLCEIAGGKAVIE